MARPLEGVEIFWKAAETTPAGMESIARVFQSADAPVLLLFDEVLKFSQSTSEHGGLVPCLRPEPDRRHHRNNTWGGSGQPPAEPGRVDRDGQAGNLTEDSGRSLVTQDVQKKVHLEEGVQPHTADGGCHRC